MIYGVVSKATEGKYPSDCYKAIELDLNTLKMQMAKFPKSLKKPEYRCERS
jgi:hypothetical protein